MITYHFEALGNKLAMFENLFRKPHRCKLAIVQIRSRSSLVYAFRERGKLGSGLI